jgi:hypothetical protein
MDNTLTLTHKGIVKIAVVNVYPVRHYGTDAPNALRTYTSSKTNALIAAKWATSVMPIDCAFNAIVTVFPVLRHQQSVLVVQMERV